MRDLKTHVPHRKVFSIPCLILLVIGDQVLALATDKDPSAHRIVESLRRKSRILKQSNATSTLSVPPKQIQSLIHCLRSHFPDQFTLPGSRQELLPKARQILPPWNQKLSRRQREILYFLDQGLAYKQIAHRLGISFETVRTHVKNLYRRLSVQNRTEAINRAFLSPTSTLAA